MAQVVSQGEQARRYIWSAAAYLVVELERDNIKSAGLTGVGGIG